jgi:hypothetical protein
MTRSVKTTYLSTTRRFTVPKDVTWGGLEKEIQGLFGLEEPIRLTYHDDDNDIVTLSSDRELRDLLKESTGALRFSVKLSSGNADAEEFEVVHDDNDSHHPVSSGVSSSLFTKEDIDNLEALGQVAEKQPTATSSVLKNEDQTQTPQDKGKGIEESILEDTNSGEVARNIRNEGSNFSTPQGRSLESLMSAFESTLASFTQQASIAYPEAASVGAKEEEEKEEVKDEETKEDVKEEENKDEVKEETDEGEPPVEEKGADKAESSVPAADETPSPTSLAVADVERIIQIVLDQIPKMIDAVGNVLDKHPEIVRAALAAALQTQRATAAGMETIADGIRRIPIPRPPPPPPPPFAAHPPFDRRPPWLNHRARCTQTNRAPPPFGPPPPPSCSPPNPLFMSSALHSPRSDFGAMYRTRPLSSQTQLDGASTSHSPLPNEAANRLSELLKASDAAPYVDPVPLSLRPKPQKERSLKPPTLDVMPYAFQLNSLLDMGFNDVKLNKYLLYKYDGAVDLVINELVSRP